MYLLSLFLSVNWSVFQNKSGDGYCAAYPVMSVNRSSGLSVNISSVVFPVSPFIQFFITKASLGNYWTVALRIRLCFHLSVNAFSIVIPISWFVRFYSSLSVRAPVFHYKCVLGCGGAYWTVALRLTSFSPFLHFFLLHSFISFSFFSFFFVFYRLFSSSFFPFSESFKCVRRDFLSQSKEEEEKRRVSSKDNCDYF